jgi:phosphatidylglycerol:prolipoprotein diacylglycerol transferase
MHPILFEIPGIGFPIRSFGLMVVLGFVVGSHFFTRLAGVYGDNPDRDPAAYARLPMWALVGILLGARACYVIVEVARGSSVGQRYLDEPLSVFYYWEGGLVMYGGLFGGISLGLIGARRLGLALAPAADIGMVVAFIGQAVGRIGCLLVGDDYGSLVSGKWRELPFPITLRVPDLAWLRAHPASLFDHSLAGEVIWCTQIWMSLNGLALFLIGRWLLKRRRYRGQVALQLLVLYSFTRSIIEAYRGDSLRGLWFDGALSTSQLISLVAGATALVFLVVFRLRGVENGRKSPAGSTSP